MNEFPSDDAIAHLAARVLDATLPRPEWTHAAHFAVALWCIRYRPDLAEAEGFRGVILRLNDAHGTINSDSSGYHHTITIASLRAARAVHDAHAPAAPLHSVLADLLSGPFGGAGWILAYWSRERLFSDEARRGWVAPDLASLPF